MKPSRIPQLITCCLTLAISLSAFAGDWYQWRGPEQNGVSREKNLPDSWDPEGENVLWTSDVGGMSSPIVMNGRVYTFARVGEVSAADTLIPGHQTQEALICIDARTGKRIWEYRDTPTQTEVPFHRLGWGNPLGDPKTGRVYGQFVDCTIGCFEGADGKLVWQRQLTEEFGMISTFGGRTASPALDEDLIYVTGVAFGWGDHARGQHRIFAFDKSTGELRWTSPTGGAPVDAPYNTPVIAVINGQKLVLVGAGDGGVHAFKARTGEKVWSIKVSKRGLNASLVVEGNRVYACQSEENEDSPTMGSVTCIDAGGAEPKIAWRAAGIEAGFASPTIADGRLYVLDNKSTVFCLDAATGKQYWKRNTGTIGKASLVHADGKLYVGEGNGRFFVLKPGEKKADVVSRTEIPEKGMHVTFAREYGIFGSVAIANGRIYLQTVNKIYCIGSDASKPESDPIPPAPQEEPVDPAGKPAFIQVRPADLVLRAGQKTNFTAWAFDAKGRPLGQVKPAWSTGKVLAPAPPYIQPPPKPTMVGNLAGSVSESGEYVTQGAEHQGGTIVATLGEVKGQARVRVLPPLPWKIDFEQVDIESPPLTWLGAGGKFAVRDDAGNKVLTKLTWFDLYYRARTNFGAVDMTNYTLQADVKAGGKVIAGENKIPDPGIINSRYVLVLLGNHQRLQIHVWPPTLPYSLNKTIAFPWQANTWYTMKLRVEQSASKAIVRGKVWPKGDSEPANWTIELEDTLPNLQGNPGLFGHSMVAEAKNDIHYDNIIITDNK